MTERQSDKDERAKIIAFANEVDQIGEALMSTNKIRGMQLVSLGKRISMLAEGAPRPECGLIPGLKEAQKIIGNGNARADWFAIEDRIADIDPSAATYPRDPVAPRSTSVASELAVLPGVECNHCGWNLHGRGECFIDGCPHAARSAIQPRFENVSCSHCGKDFGPGDHGFSHCESHIGKIPV